MSLQSTVKPYLALVRLPNLFTLPLEPVVGSVCAAGTVRFHDSSAPVMAVLFLYVAGLVLSDYFDRERDAVERPERPIPSGLVAPHHALVAGMGSLVAGVVAGASARGSAVIVSLVLAFLVLLYSFLHSRFRLLGAFSMAACRALAVLLGAAHAGAVWSASIPALVVFIYVLLLTIAAAEEATRISIPLTHALSPMLPISVPAAMALASIHKFSSMMAVFLLVLFFITTVHSALLCARGRRGIPGHIGLLIRNMIFIQGAWIMLYLSGPHGRAVLLLILLIISLRILSEVSSKAYSSS